MKFKSKKFLKLYVHQKGLFRSDMAGSCPVAYHSEFSKMTVTHEVIELLDYGGEKCNDDFEYQYDLCRQNTIFQVSTLRFLINVQVK